MRRGAVFEPDVGVKLCFRGHLLERLDLNDFMPTNQSRLDELRATGKLPSPTGVALRIMELAQQDHASITEIATILKSDPSLAGKTLRIVNSAQTGLSKPTADISYAVSVLGLRTVRRLVLAFSVVANCPRGVCHGFDFEDFWRHSLATALASQAVCNLTTVVEPEEAYCFGLLSQIGKLGLATVHPERCSKLLQEVSKFRNLAEAEQQAFGISHNQLTAALLADWGLPEVVTEAVLIHEHPIHSESDSAKLANVLRFSSCMADAWFAPPSDQQQPLLNLLEASQFFGFSSETVTQIAGDAMEDWSEWCRLLEIDSASAVSLDTALQELEEDGVTATSSASPDAMRILIVDDDVVSLRYMERHLANAGHELATASTANDALRVWLEFNPQMVITDWMMPETDGLQLCRTIRQTEIGRQLSTLR